MKLFLQTVILLWFTTRLTETTFPGMFLLPFISPKLPPKPTSTQSPSLAVVNSHVTRIPVPVQHQSVQFQNDFVKLHKWLEQTQQSTYVSTNKNEKSRENQALHLVEATQPQLHRRPDTGTHIIVANPSQHFVPSEGQVAALATHIGMPQRSLAYHQQQVHHPVPLTFPPTGSTDEYNFPKVIALPPLPPSQHQQQELPQPSSHYTTSSLSYSLSQGYGQSYGQPTSTKIVRHVSVFVAPPDIPYNSQNRQKIRVRGEAEKHVNVIFIKSPDPDRSNAAEIELPPRPEQKTYVYVLSKSQEGPNNVVVNTPEPPKYNPPDVFFIKYKGGQNQQQQQYGAPPQQQYEPPPQQHYGPPPQQQYGLLPPQQHYGSPPPQQHVSPPQQQYGSPPQQRYGQPPQQHMHQRSGDPSPEHIQPPPPTQPHQHKQPPSLEYVAPSNQKFNYTLPSSVPLSPSSVFSQPSNNTHEKGDASSKSLNSLGAFLQSVSRVDDGSHFIGANRRISEESNYHAHHFNYTSSEQSHQNWKSKHGQQFLVKVDQDQKHQFGRWDNNGLYSQLSKDINYTHIKSGDRDASGKPTKYQQEIFPLIISPAPTTAESVTMKSGDTVSVPPTITARSFFPSSTPNVEYTPVEDNIANGELLLLPSKNVSFGESTANSGTGSNKSEIAGSKNSTTSDIMVLTKRNLTTIASDDLVDDNVKKKDKGSPRGISGRPDDFRPYNYAPSMGHEYFGITGDKDIY